MNNREALIALNLLPRIGPVRVRRMIDFFGSAAKILAASRTELMRVDGLGEKTVDFIIHWEDHIDLVGEMESSKSRNISIVTQDDENYPKPLLETYDPPLVLYVWGELKRQDDNGIAMVGSRKHTHYGQTCARKLSFQLANQGFTVISGLARGIDTFSHEGAIAAGGRTIAVIGSGLAQLYPPENMALAEKIASGHGAVVSEFPLHYPPDKRTFPMRNRIVAGWAESVLVVECPKWSGSLITANLAADIGKPIYAVPGAIDSPTSAGCNELIRNGATLVTCAEDLLSDRDVLPLYKTLSKNEVEKTAGVNPALSNLSEIEHKIYSVLSSSPLLMDQIIEIVKLPLPQITVTLLQLELKKLVRQLPGQQYIKYS